MLSYDKIRTEKRSNARVTVIRESWAASYRPGAYNGWRISGLTEEEGAELLKRLGDRYQVETAYYCGEVSGMNFKKVNSKGNVAKPSEKEVRALVEYLDSVCGSSGWSW